MRYKKEINIVLFGILLAFCIRTFIVHPYRIPSSSMYPTLQIGDFILVSKFSYGYSNYSFPFAPNLFEGRFLEFQKPERGQVIVFRNPIGETKGLLNKMIRGDQSSDYVKRLIGLPGDRLQIKDGIIHINGEPVKLKKIGEYIYDDKRYSQTVISTEYEETLPNGVSYRILKEYPFGIGQMDNTPEYIIPDHSYFFMGDNRDRSYDSRSLTSLGIVPENYLIGKAQFIFFSTDTDMDKDINILDGVKRKRILNKID